MSRVQIACLHHDLGQAEYICHILDANGIDATVCEHMMDFPEPVTATSVYIILHRALCQVSLWPVAEAQEAFHRQMHILPVCLDGALPLPELSLFAGDSMPILCEGYPFFTIIPDLVRRVQLLLGMSLSLPLVLAPDALEEEEETPVSEEPSMEFADPNLERAIQLSLQSSAPITKTMAKTVHFLDLRNCELEKIDELTEFTSLEVLLLCNNHIRDLSPIENLMGLTILTADNNDIETIESLTRLARLESLSLCNNKIRDLTPLAYHPALRRACLSGNQINDVTPLCSAPQLMHLYLADNRIYSALPFAKLPQLTALDVQHNQIQNADALGELSRLTVLRLSGNALESGAFLKNLTNLRVLLANETKISDLAPLEQLQALRVLELADCGIKDVSPIANCTELCKLNLEKNEIEDLNPLCALKQLRTLEVGYNKVQNADMLPELPQLESLSVCGNQLRSLRAFTNMARLTHLDIRQTTATERSVARLAKKSAEITIVSDYN